LPRFAKYKRNYCKELWEEQNKMNWCKTSPEIKKIYHTWTIENYELLYYVNKHQNLKSDEFPNDGGDLQFFLQLDKIYNAESHTAVLFKNTSKNLAQLGKVNLSFGKCLEGSLDFKLPKTGDYGQKYCENAFLLRVASSHGGHLIINCEITLIGECTNKSGPQNMLIKVPDCKLAEDFVAMLDTKELADVTIVTADEQKIPVHKNILSGADKYYIQKI